MTPDNDGHNHAPPASAPPSGSAATGWTAPPPSPGRAARLRVAALAVRRRRRPRPKPAAAPGRRGRSTRRARSGPVLPAAPRRRRLISARLAVPPSPEWRIPYLPHHIRGIVRHIGAPRPGWRRGPGAGRSRLRRRSRRGPIAGAPGRRRRGTRIRTAASEPAGLPGRTRPSREPHDRPARVRRVRARRAPLAPRSVPPITQAPGPAAVPAGRRPVRNRRGRVPYPPVV